MHDQIVFIPCRQRGSALVLMLAIFPRCTPSNSTYTGFSFRSRPGVDLWVIFCQVVARNMPDYLGYSSQVVLQSRVMKIRGAKEAVILISQSNDGTIGIAGGILGS